MKVREVIDKCTQLLEVPYTKEGLLDCFNRAEYELALNYLPLYAHHKCNSKVVYYTEFEHSPVRIVSGSCKFKIKPTHLEAKEEITEVVYAYTPDKKTLYDECEYVGVFLDCLVYKMIAEYLCDQGFYEESILWDKKYKKEIQQHI